MKLSSYSRQSIIIMKKEFYCEEVQMHKDLANNFDGYALRFNNNQGMMVLVLKKLEEQTVSDALQLFNNLKTDAIICGNIGAQIGKKDRKQEDAGSIGHQLYHDWCNPKGILLKKLALSNNLKIQNTFSFSKSLSTTQLKNNEWFQNSHIMAIHILWQRRMSGSVKHLG